MGGIQSEKEAVNFLLDKVGDPHITSYVNHVSRRQGNRRAKHAIIPDIHATNFPVCRQTVNDSGSTRDAEAIFEVKTFTACKTRYVHPNNTTVKPVDQRSREVVNGYHRKFKKLDTAFASDVVGDGKNDIKGPFETAQGRFYRGQAIPICAGWFGEINEDFKKTIKVLAREADAGGDGTNISPLVNTDRKGGAFPIMLQHFRRAIGIAIVRGNANHKLGRLHYVQATAEEAANTCRANHSDYRYKPSEKRGSSWYAAHVPEGYSTFAQFRNGYDFCMP